MGDPKMTAPAARSDLNRSVRSAGNLLIVSSGLLLEDRFGIAASASRNAFEGGAEIKMNASSVAYSCPAALCRINALRISSSTSALKSMEEDEGAAPSSSLGTSLKRPANRL